MAAKPSESVCPAVQIKPDSGCWVGFGRAELRIPFLYPTVENFPKRDDQLLALARFATVLGFDETLPVAPIF